MYNSRFLVVKVFGSFLKESNCCLNILFAPRLVCPVITVFQVPSAQFNGLLNPVTKILFEVISYILATACVNQVTLYAAVDMKDKKEERQRGSKLQDYGQLSYDAVWFCRCLPTSQKNLLHAVSTLKKGTTGVLRNGCIDLSKYTKLQTNGHHSTHRSENLTSQV